MYLLIKLTLQIDFQFFWGILMSCFCTLRKQTLVPRVAAHVARNRRPFMVAIVTRVAVLYTYPDLSFMNLKLPHTPHPAGYRQQIEMQVQSIRFISKHIKHLIILIKLQGRHSRLVTKNDFKTAIMTRKQYFTASQFSFATFLNVVKKATMLQTGLFVLSL